MSPQSSIYLSHLHFYDFLPRLRPLVFLFPVFSSFIFIIPFSYYSPAFVCNCSVDNFYLRILYSSLSGKLYILLRFIISYVSHAIILNYNFGLSLEIAVTDFHPLNFFAKTLLRYFLYVF